MIDDIETRRRRAVWRASHRGTRELDLLIGAYATARVGRMDESELRQFEEFLMLDEPQLQAWLLASAVPEDIPFLDIVVAVRAHHGLRPVAQ